MALHQSFSGFQTIDLCSLANKMVLGQGGSDESEPSQLNLPIPLAVAN